MSAGALIIGSRRQVLFFALALFLGMGSSYFALAQTGKAPDGAQTVRTVEALGVEPVEGGDFPQAREKAIQAGLVKAVEIVLQDLVAGGAGGAGQIRSDLAARIQDQPSGFIRNYRVIEESAGDDGQTYRARVEAAVAVDILEGMLGEAAEKPAPVSRPAILLAIAEQGVNEFSPRFWWGGDLDNRESAAARSLGRILGEDRYPLVSHRTAAQDSRFTAQYTHPELTDQQVLDLGSRLGADVVIHGQARALPGPASLGTKISTARGTLNVRVFHVGSGRLVTEMVETAVTVGTDGDRDSIKALERAGAAVADRLRAPLGTLVKGPGGALRDLEVSVTGTTDLPRFVHLRRTILALPGVGGLQLMALQHDGAMLRVAFEGSNERLRDLLNQRLAAELNLSVEAMDFSRVRITLPASRGGAGRLKEIPLGN